MWLVALVFVVLSWAAACPASADVAYTITLTDDQAEALQEQTRLTNEAPKFGKGPKPPDRTPTQLLERNVRALIDGWDAGHRETIGRKSWSDLTTQQKSRRCQREKMNPCPN